MRNVLPVGSESLWWSILTAAQLGNVNCVLELWGSQLPWLTLWSNAVWPFVQVIWTGSTPQRKRQKLQLASL